MTVNTINVNCVTSLYIEIYLKMNSNTDIRDVFAVFSLYGLRKTSMDNVADALSISRQTLYKKFGSKEELIHWMVSGLVATRAKFAAQALMDQSLSVKERLVKSFDTLTGQFVEPLRNSPHSVEILQLVDKTCRKTNPDLAQEMREKITALFLKENIFPGKGEAEDTALILQHFSLGLMHTAEDRNVYLDNMKRAINRLIS